MRIKDRDYPAVVPSDKAQDALFKSGLTPEQRSVQGILVGGITAKDLDFLDEFEADVSLPTCLQYSSHVLLRNTRDTSCL